MSNSPEIFSRPNAEARIHDFEQFILFADSPDRPNFRARLQFGERNGAPRLSYFPNQAEGPKVVGIGFTPAVFEMFLNELEEVARGEPGQPPRRLANYGRDTSVETNSENQNNPPKILRNHLVFGKDSDGVVWLGVQQKDVPKNLRFKLLISDWHHFVKEDGTPVSQNESSVRYTLGLINSLRRAMTYHIGKLRPWYDPATRRNKGGAGGGAAATSSGRPTSQFEDFSEDITF